MDKAINFNVNFIKFVAICLITCFHIEHFYNYNFPIINYGWLGCALFFIASGFLNADNKENKYKTLIKRIIRLLPLYYLSLFFWFFVKNFDISLIEAIKYLTFTFNFNLATFHSFHSVAWFCAVLLQIYLIYFLIIKNFEFKKYFIIANIILLQLLTLFISVNYGTQPTITKSVLVYLPCFLAGILIKRKKYNEIIITVITSLILLLIALKMQIKYTFLLEYIISNSIFIILINIKLNMKNFAKSIINNIAQASYSIYLFNYVFIFIPKLENNVINMTANFIFVIFTGITINKLIEKNLLSKLNKLILTKILYLIP